MKRTFAISFIFVAYVHSHAQIQVSAWTDKSSYSYGDTVAVTITAYNPTADTVVLQFPSTCQVSYSIDDFQLINHIACGAVVTSRTVFPHATVQWNPLKYPGYNSGWALLSTGPHSITGQVLGYATSDTFTVFVTTAVSVSNTDLHMNSFHMNQNFPNPFNPTTTIEFSIPSLSNVDVTIFDLLGRQMTTLVHESKQAGRYRLQWNAGDLASGVYVCRLQAGSFTETRTLVLVR